MIHDPDLIDNLLKLPQDNFDGDVFRATGLNADPTAFSSSGGRWAPEEESEGGFSILYTSLERDGAIAEVASYLAQLNPIPTKPLQVSTLTVSVEKALKIAIDEFGIMGIDRDRYAYRNYDVTQRIGAAVNFLELDGLIAPSARWECDNLMIFENNHDPDARLEITATEKISSSEWQALSTKFSFLEFK